MHVGSAESDAYKWPQQFAFCDCIPFDLNNSLLAKHRPQAPQIAAFLKLMSEAD